MSLRDGGEHWRIVAALLNEENGTRFDVPRRAPPALNHLPRRNPAVKVLARKAIVKKAPRVERRKRR